MICPLAVASDLSAFGRPGSFGAFPRQEVPLVLSRVRRGAGDAHSGGVVAGDRGQIQWFQAAEILGVSCRTIRRWKVRFERRGYDVFIDRRRQHPSPKRVPVKVIQQVLGLYRERYSDFHVKHFHTSSPRNTGSGRATRG